MTATPIRVRDVLTAVYKGVEGYANVRTLPPVQEAFFPVADVDALEAFVKPRRDRNVYIGVAARLTDHDGSLKGCGPLPALFVDQDFKDSTEAETRQHLETAVLPPSLVVHSGGGLQSWWFLKEAIDVQRAAPTAKTLLRRLARSLNADLAAAEPARILRLPNTQNLKKTPARPVRIELFEPDRRYNVCDFDDWLPDEPPIARVLPGPTPDLIPQGQRETVLMTYAGAMRRKGMDADSMRLARQWPVLEAKAQRVADLPLREALALLTAPRAILPRVLPLRANASDEELFVWLQQLDERPEALEHAWNDAMAAYDERATPTTAEGWRTYLREADDLLKGAIRITLEAQRNFVMVIDGLNDARHAMRLDASTEYRRGDIEQEQARLTGWLRELEAASR